MRPHKADLQTLSVVDWTERMEDKRNVGGW